MSSHNDHSARDPVRLLAAPWAAESPFVEEAIAEEQAPIHPWYRGYSPFVEGWEEVDAPGAGWDSDAAALEAESPFQSAFERDRTSLIEPGKLEGPGRESEQGTGAEGRFERDTPPAPPPTKCGFYGPNGVFITEADLRSAMANAARQERQRWLDSKSRTLQKENNDRRFGDLVRYWLAGLGEKILPGKLEAVQQAALDPGIIYGNLGNPTLNAAIGRFGVAEKKVNDWIDEVYKLSAVEDSARAKFRSAYSRWKTADAGWKAADAAVKRAEARVRGAGDQSRSAAQAALDTERAALGTATTERDAARKDRDAEKKNLDEAARAREMAEKELKRARTARKPLENPASDWKFANRQKTREALLAQAAGTDAQNIDDIVDEALKAAHRSRADVEAWSAVFVVSCVRAAAIGRRLEAMDGGLHVGKDGLLKASRRHSDYVVEARKRKTVGGKAVGGTYHAFDPGDPVQSVVQIGDIVCTDRTDFIPKPVALKDLESGRNLHCDIVTSIVSENGKPTFAETIGGNVRHTVRRRRYPLDSQGRLVVSAGQLFAQEEDDGTFLPFETLDPVPTTMLAVKSTGRILALLSPVVECRKPAPAPTSKGTPTGKGERFLGRSLESLQSPFLDETILPTERRNEFDPSVERFADESPFAQTLGKSRTIAIEPEELGEEFVTEDLPIQRQSWQPLTLPQACQEKLKNMEMKPSVAVVGGGLAGLMAARWLGQQGIKVTVFEARSQWGGRVLSNKTFGNGRITEEGAELIGSFHTAWLALARKYGLAVVSRMDKDLYERAGLDVKLTLDKKLPADEIRELDKQMETRVLEPIARLAGQISDPSQPWLEPWLEKYDKMSVADALVQLYGIKRDERLWKAIEFKLVNDEVAPLEEMNFLGLLCKVRAGQDARFSSDDGGDLKERLKRRLMRYWNELEIFRCADGCQTLATRMAREIKARYGASLHLGKAVTHINISKQGVRLGFKQVVNERKEKLADGLPTFIPYSHVILAIPPSVWAGVNITFTADGKTEGAHPKDKIGPMGMDPAIKCFSDVKKRFWIEEKPPAAPSGGSLKLGQVWEGTDNQTRVDDKQGIVLSVFAGPIIPIPLSPGKAAHRAPNKDECKKELRNLYSGYTDDNLNKKDLLYRDWPAEPFINTGYYSPRTGEIFKIGPRLRNPFLDRLFFAGEHTQLDFFGYMEGALRSGERAARALILQACSMWPEAAPASSRPPVRTASAGPTRARTASEHETEIPPEDHSSTGHPGETEPPFLLQEPFVGGSEEEWEPRAAALVADELEGGEQVGTEEIWEELEGEQLTSQTDPEEEGSLHEGETDLEELYGHEHELRKELAELKETEGLESDEEGLDQLTEDSGEEEAAEDEFDAGPGATALEEHQLPTPKDTELRHFHVKKTLNVAGSLDTAATPSLMKPLEMRPAYIDPWLDTLETDTSATGLQGLLSELMLGRWSNFLSPESLRDKKAHATDRFYVALVDLTGAKLSKPEFAGWAPTEAVDGASIPKILALYALFQLRFDLNHLASANLINKKADLLKRAENHWKSTGLAGRPSLGQLFSFVEESGKPVQVKFQRWLGAVQFDINGNCSVTRLMNGLGFDYIGSVALQSDLRHPARGGLWLGTTYKCGDTKSTRWRRDPAPLIASCVAGDQSGHHITALSAATYYTLLAQGRLVDEPSSRELMTRLKRGCSLSPGGFHNGLGVLGGVTRTAQKCGLLRKCTHESIFVERDRFRYVAVALAKGGGVPFNLLIQDLDKIIQRRNP